jgi:RNA polymerase sigma-70 factor (ECF subfamily)
VLSLYSWADLSYSEIADAMELPIGTVRSRLARGRQRIRELLSLTGQDVAGADRGDRGHG